MKKAFKILNVVCIVTILLLSVFSTLSPIIDTSPKNIIKAYEQPFSHDCKNSAKTEQEESNELIDCNSPHISIPAVISSCISGCTEDTCNGYKYSGAHYGANTIPFTIDQSAINEGLEEMIMEAVNLWNSATIYDTATPIVNLQRNGTSTGERPVCNLMYMSERPAGISSDTNAVFQYGYRANEGHFLPNSAGNFRILIFDTGKDVNIIAHELGHLLGLSDLPTHNVLMGYKSYGMQYQDIQGAALFNLRHTSHTFYRYIDLGEGIEKRYRHICFYCDGYEDKSSIASGAELLVQSPYICSSHSYQSMVSVTDKQWDRCTDCYKVRLAKGDLYYDSLETHPSSPVYIFSSLSVSGLIDENKINLIIPDVIDAQAVVRIEDSAFAGNTELKNITLPKLLTSIGNSAFFNCTGLTVVELPSHLSSIEAYAFQQCTNLTKINIPSSVTNISWAPFIFCSKLTIYVELSSAPATGWDETWNVSKVTYSFDPPDVIYSYHTVIWGAKF